MLVMFRVCLRKGGGEIRGGEGKSGRRGRGGEEGDKGGWGIKDGGNGRRVGGEGLGMEMGWGWGF